MNEKGKKIVQIFVSTVLLLFAVIIDKTTNISLIYKLFIYLPSYFVAGYDVLKEAIEGIFDGNLFNEDFLMSIATIGSLLIGFLPNSESKFLEAVFVMLFFQVGELFEIISEGNSEKSINSLMEIRPDVANLLVNGKINKVDPNKVKVNDYIMIYPGEKVPMDGTVVEGNTNLNTVAITGESIPKSVEIGDKIISGCVNINGTIKVKVDTIFAESTASKIINLVKNATDNKSSSDKFITKFAKIYTPIVVFSALALAIIPSIITGNYAIWISRALTFLIVSCPCALVISVPLSYFGGIGGAAKKGILIKGANYLEELSNLKTIVFDKTGTLTEGVFEVIAIHPNKYDKEYLLHVASHVENHSTHPIAISLKEAYSKDLDDKCRISGIEELAGLGAKAKVNDDTIYVGNQKLMDSINIKTEQCDKVGTIVHIASSKQYLGHIIISDKIKEDSKDAIMELKKHGIKTIMLTGDIDKIASSVASKLQIDDYYAELMPQDKVSKIEELLKKSKDKIAFVGDGINDAPVIARCDIGVAMGALGSDAAIEAADIVLMEDKISKLSTAINISKRTQKIVIENIYFALIIKFVVLLLAAFGFVSMWLAVFADVGVTIIDILNATRTLK